MNNRSHKEELKYVALSEAVLAAMEGEPIDVVARKGLNAAVAYIGLAAGALLLWDNKGEVITRAIEAGSDEDQHILLETESSLLMMLRRDFKLNSAYMELGGEKVKSVFFLPIGIQSRPFGALIGVKMEKSRLLDYDQFLRSLAAVLGLATAPEKAIDDLAIGVNHEINNLLTPLLGNLDLLRAISKSLPEEVQKKLEVIRESANQIKEVTARLKMASKLPRVPYIDGEWMIKLSDEDEGKNEPEDKDNSRDKE